MGRRYEAFTVRHWALAREPERRIEVVHLRSGERALGTSLAQVVTWMQARATPGEVADGAMPAGTAEVMPHQRTAVALTCSRW